ncbi:tRNA preQ1(34) S-adenosylmethionine ribosyltransferase-isomerase QueA [Ethanoligenens harbinense]|uniref:S-adenosylmethionine:tRNA ribosyltransferase-isomerase n=1 Tax=Ethanoligenens harbinense (strain DSM 18485 / JCM 12961 / CGMCC 1.5033 / YUAN-3) TaxID=663278 RepID=E6U6Z3_ETHHY|nr:tRNA preQ1(34) S-adenosylmethionine ribosyltransferase-isomerase QueA [Ethanoligenens harbinense]ADU26960.1 S-adenosylmethionine/tRNA-ribosyltransferase-isomerase [Ethanoligenens harbinense YUAN-3]AVQ96050.1 tRNA preQ1(34) S-adenosylmethionine ribosyltransferase-isomerase QueA [Ethanoligenens harbinense YUAN-3]AYF38711.1 tRNA preQ1(34) S-adenosylmethionine ribosyltransferase-isomerase QueA [Ethanoligenens harbinense]AYF41458.1 tRNA preQ1(34) S-adenosylmethionine ribosyltransferase-isomerase 
MKKSDFYYDLPPERIAQEPLAQRDQSRLMTLDRATGAVGHRHFYDLPDLLLPGDCLILNNSRVLPARLYGNREKTGGRVEFVLLNEKKRDEWEVILRPGRTARVGARYVFGGGLLKAEVLEIIEDGNRIVRFEHEGDFYRLIEQIGEMPLPHYITHRLKDKERYQTVYAKESGSAAAPTAGLHFTPELLEHLRQKGVRIGYVTLHVGLGTFRPVKADTIEKHVMHSEHYELPEETAALIRETKASGGRVVGVGTTSCRTLESVAQRYGEIRAAEGWTDIFIYPGFQFQVLDALITNFHLPESTLIMLVSAFAGREHVLHAYQEAIAEQYRFYSFGDAMLLY